MNEPKPVITMSVDSKGVENPVFFCPGCKCAHKVWVNPDDDNHAVPWKWNGDKVKPTFEPSIMIRNATTCHSGVTNGIIHFYEDSTHELSGKYVPLEPVWE